MTHLCMKFYTPNGIGVVRGYQKSTRKCYLEDVKKINQDGVNHSKLIRLRKRKDMPQLTR